MSEQQTSPPIYLAIGDGEGCANMRVVRNQVEMVDWLWEQCGPGVDETELQTRAHWVDYLDDDDNWHTRDGFPRWRIEIEIGETGRIEFQRLHDDVARELNSRALLEALTEGQTALAALIDVVESDLRGASDEHFAALEKMRTALAAAKVNP